MLRLPSNAPTLLRELLQQPPESMHRFLSQAASALTESFQAMGHVVAFEREGEELFTSDSYGLGEKWVSSDIHRYVQRDLNDRLAPISYSSFSWPYAHIERIPAEYTLFLPFSSQLIVSLEREKQFTGYIALLFPGFPSFGEEMVQLVILLPTLLSEVISGLYRAREARGESLGAFAHNVKHYLMIHHELVQNVRDTPKDAQEKFLGRMEKAQKRLLLETNAFLLADKDDSGILKISPMPISLNELVEEAANELRSLFESAKIELVLEFASGLRDSLVDPAVFPAVLNNLLDNALKYTEAGGRVTVRTEQREETVLVSIEDTGRGVPEDERSHIFSRNYRASNVQNVPGNGLGLYLVQRIVEAHEGSVFLDPSWEQGFKISIELPALER